ncbi:ATP-binding protein [Streptomyces sp. NPDC002640]
MPELTGNAVHHGFHLRHTYSADTLRIEVTDARTERVPPLSSHEPPGDVESGRELLFVAQLTSRWAVAPRVGAPGKTVWVELCLSRQ